MENKWSKAIAIFFLGIALGLTPACGGNSHSHDHGDATTTEDATQGKEYTSKYICPMHCAGSGSHDPGKCPVCGMDYVLNESYKEE